MAAAALMEPIYDVDKLSYEIFSILESKFLFGNGDNSPALSARGSPLPDTPVKSPKLMGGCGKVRILSIDGGGALLAGAALTRVEASLRRRTGDPAAHVADFFDVAAGSGAGGVLAAMLFARGPNGRPLWSAEDALRFLAKNRSKISCKNGIFDGIFRRRRCGGMFRRVFGEATLRDTVKPLLVPCYDLASGAPFLFSRADAVEMDSYDFRISDVCAATCADSSAVEMRSVDGRTRISAVGGGLSVGNPTAAAITHVLNNKQEFPFAAGVEDLLVLSLGGGEMAAPSAAELVRIAGEGSADMVDQAVAMAFGQNKSINYVRIQAHGFRSPKILLDSTKTRKIVEAAEEMLAQRNVESMLFQGRKISEQSSAEKLELFTNELIKEQDRRKTSVLPAVMIKQVMTPRTSSATTASRTSSAITTATRSSMASIASSPSRWQP